VSAAGVSMRWPDEWLALLLVGAVSSTACGGAASPGSPTAFVVPTPETAPEGAIAAFLDEGGLPALLVGVIDGGQTLYTNVAGVRKRGDETPVTVDDAFHIGSNTKAMTALVAGTVVDAGQLTWDATVGDVLANTIDVGESYRTVTLAQLLNHSSGLPESIANSDAESFYGSTAPLASERRRLAELALALPPKSAPGMYFRYSNLGYVVAGLMLEVVTGKSWEALLEKRLFTPLAMAHAAFGMPATPGLVDAPWGHEPLPEDAASHDATFPEAYGPSGTVHANLADLIGYVHLYLDGGSGPQGRVISEAALAEIETPRLHHYGFGWFLGEDENGQFVMWHNGSVGGFYSTLVLFPARRGAIIMVTNAGDNAAWNRIGELDAYLSAHFGLPLRRPPT
jgi:CubicO group peptidase (beta-lactamase class C family)